ncbi:MAG: chloride channel protein [Planctomycetota bacterium]
MPRRFLRTFWRSENVRPVILAISVGVVGGFGAIAFRLLIEWATELFFDGGENALSFLGNAYVVVLPAIGLLIVSFIVNRWAPEAQGHGVPEVMYALRKRQGRIRPRIVGVKAIASAICIGSGGSVGREGPIVQIGCAFGSTVGQFLKLGERHTRVLVACGAAAGVGGTFNAPIAGVIFALEVILGDFKARSFGLVVISSVVSTAVVRSVLDEETAFQLTEVFALKGVAELPIYALLGIVAGLVALLFVRVLYYLEHAFEAWRWHYAIKALTGGLVVGGLGWFGVEYLGGRYLFGVGYDGIQAALHLNEGGAIDWSLGAGLTLGAFVLLVLLKILATSMTLAAGGSGGVFAPSIFIGAMVGGGFGLVVNAIFPGMTAPPGAYALVGMGAVFAGCAHAPMTAILILFEMTDDYLIILPLMIAVVIAYLIASSLKPDSVYSIKLRRLGGYARETGETGALDFILVADAMATDWETAEPCETVESLAARIHRSHTRSYLVMEEDGGLDGIVTEYDVEGALMAGDTAGKTVSDIMTRSLRTCAADERLRSVLQKITALDVGQIPVVSKDDPRKVVGVLRRREILWAFGEMASENRELLDRTNVVLPADHRDSAKAEIEIHPGHRKLAMKPLRKVDIPQDFLCILLRRADRSLIPRGSTVLEPGDVLTVVTIPERGEDLAEWVKDVTG